MYEAQAIRFDREFDAWIVTRHADVSAMLRDSRVVVPGTAHQTRVAGERHTHEPSPHHVLRDSALHALAPAVLEGWREELHAGAQSYVRALASHVPVDLVHDFAAPWSRDLASRATGVSRTVADDAAQHARVVFLAAAHATGATPDATVHDATAALSQLLHAGRFHAGDFHTGARADVQTFVALSETLPGVLAACWLALLEHPDEMETLRDQPDLLAQAVHELLRYTSPSRAVFREAAVTMELEGAKIMAGDRLILRLDAANGDAAQFENPTRLHVRRLATGQLALGAGTHRCAGTTLVRLAVRLATQALLERDDVLTLAGEVRWVDGYAIRAVSSLPVKFVTRDGTTA